MSLKLPHWRCKPTDSRWKVPDLTSKVSFPTPNTLLLDQQTGSCSSMTTSLSSSISRSSTSTRVAVLHNHQRPCMANGDALGKLEADVVRSMAAVLREPRMPLPGLHPVMTPNRQRQKLGSMSHVSWAGIRIASEPLLQQFSHDVSPRGSGCIPRKLPTGPGLQALPALLTFARPREASDVQGHFLP